MRVAVIGTGIAGNAAAWALSKRYPVTVYDREFRPGGHSHTVTIDYDGEPLAVDIGFIVYNELNYPDLTALFAHLGVETTQSCMSFAVTADAGRFEWKGGGHTWRGTAQGLFAQPQNLLSPSYLWMLRDILTFNTQSIEDYAAGKLAGLTLGEYFAQSHFAPRVKLRILETDSEGPLLSATFSGRRRSLTTAALLRSLFSLPLLTFKIVAAIHWEALRLWLKGARLAPRENVAGDAARRQTRLGEQPAQRLY
jgi:predicted NAD/FAD-binding protein